MPELPDDALTLLHLLSLNESQQARGELVSRIDADPPMWEDLARAGAIDEEGAITAIGREILGEIQPGERRS